LEILPASPQSYRQAVVHLQAGGVVVTGMDYPAPGIQPQPRFFGRPAQLPAHYVYMAIKADAPVLVAGSRLTPTGRYEILASEFLTLRHLPDHHTQLQENAEMLLEVAAGMLRQAPEMWVMTHPVWPAETVPQ
jgi:KDO2-lipid IV(A) lauroyltransferase